MGTVQFRRPRRAEDLVRRLQAAGCLDPKRVKDGALLEAVRLAVRTDGDRPSESGRDIYVAIPEDIFVRHVALAVVAVRNRKLDQGGFAACLETWFRELPNGTMAGILVRDGHATEGDCDRWAGRLEGTGAAEAPPEPDPRPGNGKEVGGKEKEIPPAGKPFPGPDGPYYLQQRLGKGGEGEVWRAYDNAGKQSVALKIFDADVDRALLVRVKRHLERFTHDNIVRIHRVEVDHHPPFEVMEYVEGSTLTEWVEKERLDFLESRDLGRLLEVFLQMVDGLRVLHAFDLVHRDIKPANIIITAIGHAKILDMGLVKSARDRDRTATSHVKGTVPYMSPEQFGGRALEGTSDVFSLGVLFFEVLAGRHPFVTDRQAGTVAYSRAAEDPDRRAPSLFDVVSGLPGRSWLDRRLRRPTGDAVADVYVGLDYLFGRVLDKDPLTRWSGDDVRRGLRQLHAQLVKETYRGTRTIPIGLGRELRWVAAGAAALAAFVVVIVIAGMLARQGAPPPEKDDASQVERLRTPGGPR